MPLTRLGRVAAASVFASVLIGSSVSHAGGDVDAWVVQGLHGRKHNLRSDVRDRDPTDRPSRRRGLGLAPPPALIQAYLPRATERPMYNEPPSRFPRR